jgi:uncharacterized membrane protein YgaE (UPF0421/DUF939 family)
MNISGSKSSAGNPGRVAGYLRECAAALLTAVQFALVAAISFSIALIISTHFPGSSDSVMIGALWALISAIVVLQDTRSSTIKTAWLRIFGSCIGAVFSAVYLTFFPFSLAGMGILIGIVVFVCVLLRIPGHLRLAALTVGIVMVISALNPAIPPVINAADRFVEVIIGSSVAVCAAWIFQYVLHRE